MEIARVVSGGVPDLHRAISFVQAPSERLVAALVVIATARATATAGRITRGVVVEVATARAATGAAARATGRIAATTAPAARTAATAGRIAILVTTTLRAATAARRIGSHVVGPDVTAALRAATATCRIGSHVVAPDVTAAAARHAAATAASRIARGVARHVTAAATRLGATATGRIAIHVVAAVSPGSAPATAGRIGPHGADVATALPASRAELAGADVARAIVAPSSLGIATLRASLRTSSEQTCHGGLSLSVSVRGPWSRAGWGSNPRRSALHRHSARRCSGWSFSSLATARCP